jgi:hypothetical protein
MRLGKWLYTIPLRLHSLFGREQVEKDHAPPYCVLDKVLQVGGAGDVVLFGASGFVQQVVAANHLGIWVGKKGESVALPLPQMFRDVGRVYADGHGPDALCGKPGKIFLDAS